MPNHFIKFQKNWKESPKRNEMIKYVIPMLLQIIQIACHIKCTFVTSTNSKTFNNQYNHKKKKMQKTQAITIA